MPFVRGVWMRGVSAGAAALSLVALGACSTAGHVAAAPFHALGGHKDGPQVSAPHGDQPGIGVNGYLWRATLDTLAFMPLASADPYGGVIITDWYANPEQPAERFKVTVYILDTRLRADGLNVTVFKQAKDPSGAWTDASVAGQTDTDLENAILTRARQLRLSNVR